MKTDKRSVQIRSENLSKSAHGPILYLFVSFLQNKIQWKTKLNIKDGEFKVGIRPHNITTYKEGSNTLEIKGKVLISEISGSESLIHFTNGDLSWVSLSNGVFQKNVGDEMNLYMNTDEIVYFDQNERLISNG